MPAAHIRQKVPQVPHNPLPGIENKENHEFKTLRTKNARQFLRTDFVSPPVQQRYNILSCFMILSAS